MNIQQGIKTISYEKARKYSLYLGWLGIDRFYIGDTGIAILKLCLFCYFIPWFLDIFIISSHKDNWDEWIAAKQVKRAQKKSAKQGHQEHDEISKERAANGQCPKCGSSNLTAVSETTNKQSKLAATFQILDAKFIPNDKIVSTTKRVCLNCGNTF